MFYSYTIMFTWIQPAGIVFAFHVQDWKADWVITYLRASRKMQAYFWILIVLAETDVRFARKLFLQPRRKERV